MGQILGAHSSAVLIDEDEYLYNWLESLLGGREPEQTQHLNRCLSASIKKYNDPSTRFMNESTLCGSVTHLVLKAPNAVYDYPAWARISEKVSVVYLLRDVRDVVCSMRHLSHIPMVANQLQRMISKTHIQDEFADDIALLTAHGVPDCVKMAVVWKLKTTLAVNFQLAGLAPLLVHYEDLANRQYDEIKKILQYIGLPVQQGCLNYHRAYCGFGPGGTDRTRPLDSASIAKWKPLLSDQDEDAIWQVAGGLMQRLGYSREVAIHDY